MFFKIRALRNIAKFTGEHLCQSPFFNKVAGGPAILGKKEDLAQMFFCEFCKSFKSTFLTEHLQITAFEKYKK